MVGILFIVLLLSLMGCGINGMENNAISEQSTEDDSVLEEKLVSEKAEPQEENVADISDEQLMEEFCQSFINLFNGAIGSDKTVELEDYISNKALLSYAYKIIELTQKQEELGMNMAIYGMDNEFGKTEISEISADIYYIKVPFTYQGSGSICQFIIQKNNSNMYVLDFYFGNQDGVDTLVTGFSANHKIDNPDIWNESEWIDNIEKKLLEYEAKLEE